MGCRGVAGSRGRRGGYSERWVFGLWMYAGDVEVGGDEETIVMNRVSGDGEMGNCWCVRWETVRSSLFGVIIMSEL